MIDCVYVKEYPNSMRSFALLIRELVSAAIFAVAIFCALWIGLEAFDAIDDVFVSGVLLQGSLSEFLTSLLWYTLQLDWVVLVLMMGLSLVAGTLVGFVSRRLLFWVDLANFRGGARLLDAICFAVPLLLAGYLVYTLSVDDADVSDLEEALAGLALIALPLGVGLAWWRWALVRRRNARPPGPMPATVRSHIAIGLAALVGSAGLLPWSFDPGALLPAPTVPVLEAMGARAASTALRGGKAAGARILRETLQQGARAGRRLIVDSGGRVGAATVQATTGVRSMTIRAARAIGIRNNATDGLRRQELAFAEMQRRHPNAEIIAEAMLRDRAGNVVRTSTGGRRLDLVAVENGRVITRVEVTSPSRDKFAQLTREERVRDAGGNFVRGRDGTLHDIRRGNDDVWRVDLGTGRVVSDAAAPAR